jgi:hypothetical protein
MAAIDFPNSPSNNDVFSSQGKSWKYDGVKGVWKTVSTTTTANLSALGESVVPSANVTYDLGSSTNAFRDLYLAGSTLYLGNGQITSSANGAVTLPSGSKVGSTELGTGGATVYANASVLPTSGLTAGDFAYTGNAIFITNGSGWYRVAVTNQDPSITLSTSSASLVGNNSVVDFTYTASDADGTTPTITVTNSGFSNTSTATIQHFTGNNTIRLTNLANTAYSGTITVTASDGISTGFGTFTASVTATVLYAATGWSNTVLSIGTSDTNSLDNSSFIDRSTNALTVTTTGTPVQTAFHPYLDNWSVKFPGTSGAVYPSSDSTEFAYGTGDLTVELWFYPTATPSNQVILDQRESSPSGGGYSIECGSNLIPYLATTVAVVSGTIAMNLNEWNHVVYTRSGTDLSLYVNGARSATATNSTNLTSQRVTIGGYTNRSSSLAYGYISNVRLVKGTSLYDPTSTTITVPTEKLTAVSGTSLLTCQSNRFVDNSSTGHTLAFTGSPEVSTFNPFGQGSEYAIGENKGSVYLDGSSSVDGGTSINPSSGVCIEGWSYITAVNSFAFFFSTEQGNSGFYPRWYVGHDNSGNWRVSPGDATDNNLTSYPLVKNQWNHWALTNDGSTSRLFANGKLIYTKSVTPTSESLNFNISKYGDTLQYTTYGYISDFRASTTIPTAYQTSSTTLDTQVFTPPTSPGGISGAGYYLPMDNAGIFDKTGNYNLTLVNGTSTSTTQTKYADTSIILDGVNDYAYINTSGTLSGDFTIEMWAYVLSTGTSAPNMRLFTCNTGGNIANNLQIAIGWQTLGNEITGAIFVFSNAFIVEAGAGTAINDSAWHHIAVTRSGSSIKLFIDGTQSGSTATNSTAFSISNSNIGTRDRTGGHDHFHGYIENLQIINGVAKYTANFTPPTAEQGRTYQATS